MEKPILDPNSLREELKSMAWDCIRNQKLDIRPKEMEKEEIEKGLTDEMLFRVDETVDWIMEFIVTESQMNALIRDEIK